MSQPKRDQGDGTLTCEPLPGAEGLSAGPGGSPLLHGDGAPGPREDLSSVGNRIIVLSGKGGVGKSTVAVNLATALTREGNRVGLLDVDVHGPTIPTMLRLEVKEPLRAEEGGIPPVLTAWGLKTMSIAYFLPHADDAVIWRGPRKAGVIRLLLRETRWEDLDFLVVDCPPGTGDEPLSIAQMLGEPKSAVIVTTPQEVALAAVRRAITFCRSLGVRIQGVIENMSGYCCPYCLRISEVFPSCSVLETAHREGIPLLGKIPIMPEIVSSGDRGIPAALEGGSPAGKIFRDIALMLAEEPDRQREKCKDTGLSR